MKNNAIKKVVTILFIFIVAVGWFGWMSYNRSKDQLMESKMEAAINNAVYDVQFYVERTKVNQSSNSLPYYFARIDKNIGLVEKEALYQLNSDSSVPSFKFVQFSITWTSSYNIHITVKYPGAFGISRKLSLNYTKKVIAFKHETGSDNFSSK
ncbi:hypothetical protein M3194_00040 [Paenibacillus glycanilyticus]|uniref:hypothetical protein n=1 Tax=Paenibacillus glycanilyticus TaxID=126569 RepID=UPI002040FBF5|nr:hypothetical protein [Paenibacillus glycanilyticus]MCM3625748.1 hypothetical protein [Paenibacillus glycanilyticus]